MIKKADIQRYSKLFLKGEDSSAFAFFYNTYIKPEAQKLTAISQKEMAKVIDGVPPVEVNHIILRVQGSINDYEKKTVSIFKEFTKEVYTPILFERLGTTKPELKATIMRQTLSEFTDKTRGALANTDAAVVRSIRKMQTDIIKNNLKIAAKENIPGILSKEVNAFKAGLTKELRKNNPDFYRMLEKGTLIKSRTRADGTYISYSLENYAEMSVRTTLLNVERTSVEVAALDEEAPLVGYELIDDRPLKGEEREICQHIINNKVRGKSVLALTQDVADALGIMTIDEAKADGAMGVNCRHGLVPLDTEYLIEVEKVLLLKGLSTGLEVA